MEFNRKCKGQILIKPMTGYSGHGIQKRIVNNQDEAEILYDEMKKSGVYFCEEIFVQDGIIHEICPASC